MKKVLLDSCVFFDMVYINNVYTNMGTDGVKKYIDKKTIQAQSIVSEIERYYPDNFKKMYKGEDRLFAAMNFKDYLYKKSNEYKEKLSKETDYNKKLELANKAIELKRRKEEYDR